jgi:hypothetical protein
LRIVRVKEPCYSVVGGVRIELILNLKVTGPDDGDPILLFILYTVIIL